MNAVYWLIWAALTIINAALYLWSWRNLREAEDLCRRVLEDGAA